MTALADRLAEDLYQKDPVLDQFRTAHIRLAVELLPDGLVAVNPNEPDWQRLLTWASVLCQSDREEHVELALVAAISALLTAETNSEGARHAASFVLESCSNTRTVMLARQQGLVSSETVPAKLPAILRQHQRLL